MYVHVPIVFSSVAIVFNSVPIVFNSVLYLFKIPYFRVNPSCSKKTITVNELTSMHARTHAHTHTHTLTHWGLATYVPLCHHIISAQLYVIVSVCTSA